MELKGRRKIFTSTQEINEKNIVAEVNKALVEHCKNVNEETYLYDYRRGKTPILDRVKEVRPEINNKVVENHAEEIVTFKDGYFLTQSCFYTPRGEEVTEKVKELNDYLYRSGKQSADNKIVDDFHTVGIGVLYVEPNQDKKKPCLAYAVDPRSAFVVYSLRPGNKPVIGINAVQVDQNIIFDVFTEDYVFTLNGGKNLNYNEKEGECPIQANGILNIRPNLLRLIPIIEYRYNTMGMSSFEAVLPLLDAIDKCESNRIDSIEQFVQSLIVATNVDFEEGTTANTIMESGMVCLKSIGENKASIEILSEELKQSETQVLVDYLYGQVLTIAGVPYTATSGGASADTGTAVYLRNGFAIADTCCRNTEDLFRVSNAYFDEIFLKILDTEVGFNGIDSGDFELHFVRNEATNIQSKAQALNTLLASGVAPELAFAYVGISNDVTNDVATSKPYLDMIWGNPNEPKEETPNEEITEEAVVNEITI